MALEIPEMFHALAEQIAGEPIHLAVLDSERDTIICLSGTAKNVGKVIGVQGRTVRSLRIILNVISHTQNRKYALNIQTIAEDE